MAGYRKDMERTGASMGKIKNPIPKYDPPKPGKYGINKSVLKPTLESVIKKNPSPTTGGHAIRMTASPHEYFLGPGVAKGGINLSKSLARKAVNKVKPILKDAATDFGIDQVL